MMGRFRKDGGGPRRPAGGLGREPAARRGCLPQWRAGPWPLGGSSGRHGADRSGSGVAPRPRECDGARGQPHGFGAGTDGPFPPAATESLLPQTPGATGGRRKVPAAPRRLRQGGGVSETPPCAPPRVREPVTARPVSPGSREACSPAPQTELGETSSVVMGVWACLPRCTRTLLPARCPALSGRRRVRGGVVRPLSPLCRAW